MRSARSASSLPHLHTPMSGSALDPPPTNRLWLDLPNPSKTQNRVIQSSTNTTNTEPSPIVQTYNNIYPASPSPQLIPRTPTPEQTLPVDIAPSFKYDTSPIRPLVKSKSAMSQEAWETLQIQQRILEQLNMRTSDSTRRAGMVLDIFRSCNPDEFGLIHLPTFHRNFGKRFGLTAAESSRLFNIGDIKKNEELDFAAFRSVFVSIDTDPNGLIAPPHRGGLRKLEPPSSQKDSNGSGGGQGSPEHQSEHSIVQAMPRSERARYLQHKRIQTMIEQRLREFEACFVMQEPVRVGMSQSMVRTKLTWSELYDALSRLGMNMTGLSSSELRLMFGSECGSGSESATTTTTTTTTTTAQRHQTTSMMMRQSSSVGALLSHSPQPVKDAEHERIGFSELIKASDYYFSLLGSTEQDIEHKKEYTKLHDLYGRRLGRRRVGDGPAASGHLSQPGFLAHDDGRLGIASPDSIDRSRQHNAYLHNTQQQQQHQQFSWKDPAVVAGLASKSSAHGTLEFLPMENTGCMPRYEEAFDDPSSYLWEQRWLDKSLGEERKRKLAKKALLGDNELAQKQNHNMFQRLTFKPQGYQNRTQQPHVTSSSSSSNLHSSRPWATGLNWSE